MESKYYCFFRLIIIYFKDNLPRVMGLVYSIRGYNILFRILTFAKPSCENALQPSPCYYTRTTVI